MLTKTVTDEQIEKAVEWWGLALKEGPNFSETSDRYSEFEKKIIARRRPITDDQIIAFKTSLRQSLKAEREELKDELRQELGCWTDYYPSEMLWNALEVAGLDGGNMTLLPPKIHILIWDGGVQVNGREIFRSQ